MKKYFLVLIGAIFVIVSCEKTEQEIPVSSISISQATAEMIIGETIQLSASVQPSNATEKTISWASSKISVVTVSNGKVTAFAEGTSTITASCGGKSATCQVIVSKGVISVTSISLNKEEMSLEKGSSETLVATVKPDDATDKTVTWSSSESAVASVDNNGKVTALAGGNAVITAKAGDQKTTCNVTVNVPVESITLDRESLTLEEEGTATLVATVKPDDATDKTVTWSTSDAKIATVDEWGKVTAIKEGEATITAKSGEKEAVCAITILHNPLKDAIVFADAKIKEKLVAAFDTDNDGELSYYEAAAVTNIKGAFGSSKGFNSFDEFQYFTNVSEIPNEMFNEWSLLESIILPQSIRSIGYYAFRECQSLKAITIPEGVTRIVNRSFQYCRSLEEVVLPETLQEIRGECVFDGCVSLSSINIPKSLKVIDCVAFGDCKSLQSITLPQGLTTIGYAAFIRCLGLTSVIIPDTIDSINYQAFESCENLESVTLPKGIEILEDNLFKGCKKLNSIIIPESVFKIKNCVFSGCTGLSSIEFPASVKQLGMEVLFNCVGVNSITFFSENPPQGGSKMFDNTNNCPIFVPAESVDAYKAADYWKDYADRIQAIPE